MSKPSPYNNISISEGGRFVRYEWDVHYLTDEQMETVRKHIETLQAENAKLRELVRIMHGELVSCEDNGYVCGGHKFDERVRELGIEVDGCE